MAKNVPLETSTLAPKVIFDQTCLLSILLSEAMKQIIAADRAVFASDDENYMKLA